METREKKNRKAAPAPTEVLVVNRVKGPVPTAAQGVTTVAGTVDIGNTPQLDVRLATPFVVGGRYAVTGWAGSGPNGRIYVDDVRGLWILARILNPTNPSGNATWYNTSWFYSFTPIGRAVKKRSVAGKSKGK